MIEWIRYWLGKNPTPEECYDKCCRTIDSIQLDLKIESQGLKEMEKKWMNQTKKAAEKSDCKEAYMNAKQVIQTRRFQQNYTHLCMNLENMKVKLQMAKTMGSMNQLMSTMVRSIRTMLKVVNPQKFIDIMKEFEKLDMRLECMNDVLDDTINTAMSKPEDLPEIDTLVQQVFDELHIKNIDTNMVQLTNNNQNIGKNQVIMDNNNNSSSSSILLDENMVRLQKRLLSNQEDCNDD